MNTLTNQIIGSNVRLGTEMPVDIEKTYKGTINNCMRNLDSNSLQSLYESKVALRNILNEELPYEPGEMGPAKAREIAFSPEGKSGVGGQGQRAAMDPKYSNYPRLSPEQMQRAAEKIGQKIVDFLNTLPDQTFIHGETNKEEDEAFRDIVGDMIVNQLRLKSGESVFPKSHAVHVARQLADALIDAKVLTYTKRKGAGRKEAGGAGASSDVDI